MRFECIHWRRSLSVHNCPYNRMKIKTLWRSFFSWSDTTYNLHVNNMHPLTFYKVHSLHKRRHLCNIDTGFFPQKSVGCMTQSIRIYDHFRVSPKCWTLLFILAWTQYPLKVKSQCSMVTWWIMIIDSLVSWFTIDLV